MWWYVYRSGLVYSQCQLQEGRSVCGTAFRNFRGLVSAIAYPRTRTRSSAMCALSAWHQRAIILIAPAGALGRCSILFSRGNPQRQFAGIHARSNISSRSRSSRRDASRSNPQERGLGAHGRPESREGLLAAELGGQLVRAIEACNSDWRWSSRIRWFSTQRKRAALRYVYRAFRGV